MRDCYDKQDHMLACIGRGGETVVCTRCDKRWDAEEVGKPDIRHLLGALTEIALVLEQDRRVIQNHRAELNAAYAPKLEGDKK